MHSNTVTYLAHNLKNIPLPLKPDPYFNEKEYKNEEFPLLKELMIQSPHSFPCATKLQIEHAIEQKFDSIYLFLLEYMHEQTKHILSAVAQLNTNITINNITNNDNSNNIKNINPVNITNNDNTTIQTETGDINIDNRICKTCGLAKSLESFKFMTNRKNKIELKKYNSFRKECKECFNEKRCLKRSECKIKK